MNKLNIDTSKDFFADDEIGKTLKQMIDKINEIVDWVNSQQTKNCKLQMNLLNYRQEMSKNTGKIVWHQ